MAKDICGKIGTAMHRLSPATSDDSETEYRAIEAALLESTRGRWFLAEHGRRARRLDSALLEDAIGRLQSSLRQPPALLGQLKSEIEALKAHLAEARAMLLAKAPPAEGADNPPPHAILKAAEVIHGIAWSLQANPFDPKGCEEIARNAGKLYVLSQSQAITSERTMETVHAIDDASHRLEAMLETVIHELKVDRAAAFS
jgi:hypothetical protein